MLELAAKLNPKRFQGMSPFMAAVVGYVLGQSFTDPEIAEITVSESEGMVYSRQSGSAGFDGIQSLDDLRENWNRLREAANLSADERAKAVRLFNYAGPLFIYFWRLQHVHCSVLVRLR